MKGNKSMQQSEHKELGIPKWLFEENRLRKDGYRKDEGDELFLFRMNTHLEVLEQSLPAPVSQQWMACRTS